MQNTSIPDIDMSVVIPIFNEESVLPHLYERLTHSLESLTHNYEVIFVNDCSTDRSLALLKEFHQKNSRLKVLSFSRNFGHQVAITAGLKFSNGKAVVILDGDLQDPPELIPQFVEKWKGGSEVVYAVRLRRKDHLIKRIACKIYYRLLKILSKTSIPLDSGDCCLMDRKVVDLINAMPERNRFVRGLRSWVGFKQTELAYERDKRYAGKSKYTFFKLMRLGFDGIISFSEIPLRISVVTGFFISFASLLYAFFIILDRIFPSENTIPGWASIVAGITFLGGMQLTIMGLLGEYIIRIFDEVKARPMYILSEAIGFKNFHAPSVGHYPGV